tara:strand:- start:226 stop:885 length:660 start_codon:yes stop_codon:yes gene_type:complete
MKIFVINFPNDMIRKHFQQEQLIGLNYTIIEGINGHNLNYNKIDLNHNKNLFRKLKPGEVGCLLSHLKCYKKALEKDLKEILILEDDAELSIDFDKKLKHVRNNSPINYDILLLSSTNCWRRHQKYKKIATIKKMDDNFSLITGDHYGNQGYIITAKAMRILLDYHEVNPLTYPADLLLTKLNLNVFLLNEDILTTHRGFGSHTQSKRRYNDLDMFNEL